MHFLSDLFGILERMSDKKSRKPFQLAPKATSSYEILALLKLPITKVRTIVKRLYGWTVKWAAHPKANRALAGVSFAESSFFPLPPDPLLLTMTFAQPKKWWKLALLTTVGSVIGGLFGYFIGFALFESIGAWLVATLHLEAGFTSVELLYQEQSFWAVFAAAFTPIPYKIFTIAAGVFTINIFGFVMASIIGRGLRFFAVSGAAAVLGKAYKEQIEKYIDLISLALLGVIALTVVVLHLI
jgi:membrane protein YqaA with SNARE-associated domain